MTARRWIYALGGLVAVLAIALVVVFVARDDDSNNAADTTTTIVTTTLAPSTTTVAPTTLPPPATTVSLPPITNDTEAYAKYLFAAWQNNNQEAAAQVAGQDAINQMFSQAYSATDAVHVRDVRPRGRARCSARGPRRTAPRSR